MTADNNSTEDKPDPTPFKVYPMTNEARSKRMRGGPARGICLQGAGHQVCRSPSRRVLRGLSARQENLALATGLLMSCIQKPTTALMRRGSTAKPPSPDPLAPISGKDNHDHGTMAKVGRDEWL